MTATTIESARIAGALTCLNAMRQLEQSAKKLLRVDTVAEYYAQRLSDTRALVAALGPMAPELEGVIATLAEYIHSEIDGGTPDISPGYWIPLAAMTDDEREAMIDRVESENAAIDAEPQCVVITMAERRVT